MSGLLSLWALDDLVSSLDRRGPNTWSTRSSCILQRQGINSARRCKLFFIHTFSTMNYVLVRDTETHFTVDGSNRLKVMGWTRTDSGGGKCRRETQRQQERVTETKMETETDVGHLRCADIALYRDLYEIITSYTKRVTPPRSYCLE